MGIWMNVMWTKVRFFDLWLSLTNESGPDMIEEILSFVAPFRESFHTPPQDFTAGSTTNATCSIDMYRYPPMMWCTQLRKRILGTGWTWCMRASAMRSTSRWKRSLAAKLRNIQIKNKCFALISMFVSNNATINALTLNQILRCFSSSPKKVVDSWWQHDIMHRHPLVRRYLCV